MVDGKIEELAMMNLNFTIDHRFLDGSLGGKIAGEVLLFNPVGKSCLQSRKSIKINKIHKFK